MKENLREQLDDAASYITEVQEHLSKVEYMLCNLLSNLEKEGYRDKSVLVYELSEIFNKFSVKCDDIASDLINLEN